MSYLDEFEHLLEREKLTDFFRLWEEYSIAEEIDGQELKGILKLIQGSILAEPFGQFAETALPIWQKVKDEQTSGEVLQLILDLQTTNSPLLADLATDYLQKHYGAQKNFKQKLRLTGLFARQKFQRAISNYELLTHMSKGKFVFHTGGWGVGEVMDISLLREHVLLEFEGTAALKDLSFESAFRNLIPLSSEHFLARRFGDPDALEEEGRQDPLGLIHLLLRDLGPKNAQEIKDELCELVIPEKDWTKWWQSARGKIKKDTKIKSPKSLKEPFELRLSEVPHSHRFQEMIKEIEGIDQAILLIYNFLRDFPEVLKNEEVKQSIKQHLLSGFESTEQLEELNLARKIQVSFLLEDVFPDEFPNAAADLIRPLENVSHVLNLIDIAFFKKRLLTVVRASRKDWVQVFMLLLYGNLPNPIRDYLFKELEADSTSQPLIKGKVQELLHKMTLFPEAFVWYFQKLVAKEAVPFNDQEGKYQFLEAFLVLLHFAESKPEMKDLVKKMYQIALANRYAVIRDFIVDASVPYLKEFLLLASKCQSFSKHDVKILHSLAEVVQPSLMSKKKPSTEIEIIWTTQEGYQKLQERIQQIGTVETVENAKEIEAARAHGDLRENAEYKYALERRSRLQAELRTLTDQLNKARIISKDDIHANEVSVGAHVQLLDKTGNRLEYTLLGPWDADPEKNILSFQSKLAQAMIGCKQGEKFQFQGNEYIVEAFNSYR